MSRDVVPRYSNVWPAATILFIMSAILIVAAVLTTRVTDSLVQLRILANENRAVVDSAQSLLLAMEDAETGQRGYLLTMRPSYLEPYWRSVGEIRSGLGGLIARSKEIPWLQPEVETLQVLTQGKLGEMERSIRLAQTQGQQSGIDVILTDSGKSDMDQARGIIGRIVARAENERQRRTALIEARESDSSIGVMVAVLGGVAVLGAAALGLLVSRNRTLRAQAGARLQSERLRGAVNQIRDGVAVFDAQDRLLLWNGNFFPASRLPLALARQGMPFLEFARAAAAWQPALLGAPRPAGGPLVGEVRQDGRALEVWRSEMPDGGQMVAIADVTRRIEAEEIARQAHKMDVLGQMTGGVAHDFNNLLQVVSANLELIGSRVSHDPWLRTRLAAAMAGVERGARLTRHLLAFARRQPLAPEALETSRLMRGLEDMLRRTAGENVQLDVSVGANLWAIRADGQQLENAVLNLAINARDAMPIGGRLSVQSQNVTLGAEFAEEHGVAPGDYVVIAVGDTGTGMTHDQLSRAVEPFYTTKPEGKGTGLGLSMVYGFARQSGGIFTLESEVGRGTTARIYIPRTTAKPRNLLPKAVADLPPGRGETILLVEDDPSVRLSTSGALRDIGYRVLEAADARQAVMLLQGGMQPDLLFTDVVMPGPVNSRILVDQARKLVPNIAVMFTSGYSENTVMESDCGEPGVHIVGKPWKLEELARRLRLALNARLAAHLPLRMRILLTEDETLVRMTTADLLADMGHEVVEAGNAADALRLLDTGADLLMTDLGLPDMDGRTLAQTVRQRRPLLPVIIASGEQPDDAADVSMIWLQKPYDEAALRRALSDAAA